ncbi:ABC transporter permease [Candidatus Harpocratesius sp.]
MVFELQKEQDRIYSRQKRLTQIIDTIYFEIQLNIRKMMILAIVALGIFILSLFLGLWQLNNKSNAFPTVESYIFNYFSFIRLFILILAVSYGSDMIVIDFQEQTGNIIFPKISKDRLFLGRFLSRFFQGGIIIIFYYWLVLIPIYFEFHLIPIEFWKSLGFALFYFVDLLAFCVLFSAVAKRTSGAVIISLLIIIIAFPIINSIISLTTDVEPLFLLDYYGNIISSILSMPDPRFSSMEIEGLTTYIWYTPSVGSALIGLSVYLIIMGGMAFIIYFFRQVEEQ